MKLKDSIGIIIEEGHFKTLKDIPGQLEVFAISGDRIWLRDNKGKGHVCKATELNKRYKGG